jgi:ribosomal protein L13
VTLPGSDVIDASDVVLGRLASHVAVLLRAQADLRRT